jgi:hypothetical protein
MNETRPIADWMSQRKMTRDQLASVTSLETKIIEAMVAGRYTPSPRQRALVANALGVEINMIQWGHAGHVDHMYGHGPQFGRSP